MKTRMLHLAIPLALALGGCASQSTKDSTPPAGQPGAESSSSATSGSASSPGMSGSAADTRQAIGRPGGSSVYYEFDKSNLKPEDRKLIEAHAQYLHAHPDTKVRVEGNADERGSTEYNLALGQRRADGVAKAMELLGIPDKRVEAVSYGEEKPKAKGHDEKSWSENRRSDIVY